MLQNGIFLTFPGIVLNCNLPKGLRPHEGLVIMDSVAAGGGVAGEIGVVLWLTSQLQPEALIAMMVGGFAVGGSGSVRQPHS